MSVLKLRNAIKVNGKDVSEIKYDENEITAEAFIEAETRKFAAAVKKGASTAATLELDYSMQLELGFAAILAVNPDYDYNDLLRIKGSDLVQVVRIGRGFTMPSEATADSEESK